MAVTNTGIVLRTIIGVHDANFVHPIGDELILNGGFGTDTNWIKNGGVVISSGKAVFNAPSLAILYQNLSGTTQGTTYKVTYTISEYISGSIFFGFGNGIVHPQATIRNANGTYTEYITKTDALDSAGFRTNAFVGSIDNISVKEVLVNRESTATNTGIVERSLTGVNESDLWLDSESTSVVNNTGIVERPITGVNESDPMFHDNTISNIRNINDTTLYEELLEALQLRAVYYENEEGTTEILTNLFNC